MYINFQSSDLVQQAPEKIPHHWLAEIAKFCSSLKNYFRTELEKMVNERYELIKANSRNLKTAKARIKYLAEHDSHYLKCLIVRAIEIGDLPIPTAEIGIKPGYVDIDFSPPRRAIFYAQQHWRDYRLFYWGAEEISNAISDYHKTPCTKAKPIKYYNMVQVLRQIILEEPGAVLVLPQFCLELLTPFDWIDIHNDWPLYHDDPSSYNMFK